MRMGSVEKVSTRNAYLVRILRDDTHLTILPALRHLTIILSCNFQNAEWLRGWVCFLKGSQDLRCKEL
jgi:hypothetical protein